MNIGGIDFDMTSGVLTPEELKMRKAEEKKQRIEERKMERLVRKEEIYCRAAVDFERFVALPLRGQQFRIVTGNCYNPYTLIKRILRKTTIEEMYLAIYSINDVAAEGLMKAVELGRIKAGYFIVSVLFREYRDRAAHRRYDDFCTFCQNHEELHHAYLRNHAKVLAVRDGLGNTYVLEGSANLSDNAKIEQLLLENIPETFEFHKGWIRDEVLKYERENEQ